MLTKEFFDEFTLIRQSPVILLFQLFLLEFLFMIFYPLFRFVLQAMHNYFTPLLLPDVFWFEFALFAIISSLEILLILSIALIWMSEYYVIRSESILHRKGVFHLHEETYSLKNVETFTVQQSFIGKIFGYGVVKFYSPVLKQEYFLKNVSAPLKLKDFIQEMVLKEESVEELREKIIPRKNQ